MTEPTSRPFRMSDAMILIAATAVGFAETRSLFPETDRQLVWPVSAFMPAFALLPARSIAFAVLSLRSPRPARRTLRHQPGFVACVAGGTPSAFLHIPYVMMKLGGMIEEGPTRPFVIGTLLGSFSVSAVWAVMRDGDGWRPGRCWIDRCGIALGFLWVSIFVVILLVAVIMPDFFQEILSPSHLDADDVAVR